ncbi:unnamed protein product [Urochloa decumbens]|uniref:DUF1618 domain-containing protein n=1 Tax=Urochloa decumbens TaxID=240449 RepID=A0ABC9C520_9POAL
MPDPAVSSPPPAYPRAVLVDRCVLFIDELQDIVQGAGGLPPIEVEEILRERKASRPSAVRKEPVTFRCVDAAYYREVLDGIDLRLPDQLVAAPGVNSLTIGVSWLPGRSFPQAAYIASCHNDLLVLHMGTGLPRPWFYLVFNTWANSVAVVPPPPTRCITTTSHCDIGAGVAVQCHRYGYILAELYLRRDSQTHLASNRATLFVWSSPGFSPLHGWWVQQEVVLPLPADEEDHRMPPTYSFHADIVFAASATSLCWVDLRTGILVCDGIGKLVGGGSTGVDFRFRFIPLPEECAHIPGSLSPISHWSQVEEYRSMSCTNRDTIAFACIDGYNHSPPTIEATLTTWTLKLHLMDDSRWEKRTAICIRDLLSDLPFMKDGWKLLQLMPSCSIIPGVTYLSIAASQSKPEHEQLEAVGFYQLRLDTLLRRVLSVYEFPYGSRIVPYSKTWMWDHSQQCREIMELRMEKQETKELRFEVEESKGRLSKIQKGGGTWGEAAPTH